LLHRSWAFTVIAFLIPPLALPVLAFKDIGDALASAREKDQSVYLEATDDAGQLIRALGDDRRNVREQAAQRLQGMGPQALAPLRGALQDADARVRGQAARMLDEFGWQPTTDQDRAAYWAARCEWDKCVAIGAPAVEPLLLALRTGELLQKEAIVRALGAIGDPRAAEPLTVTLEHGFPNLQEAAARALEQVGVPAETVQSIVANAREQEAARSQRQGLGFAVAMIAVLAAYVALIVLVFFQPTIPLWAGTLMVAPTPIFLILSRIFLDSLKSDDRGWGVGCGIALGLLPGGLLLLGLVWLFQREAFSSFFQALFS
jgi:hypothetical protein